MEAIIQHKHFKKITDMLIEIGERVEGNLFCDFSPTNFTYEHNKSKILNVQSFCRDKERIIEIGINACHSLLLMLLTNPHAHYLLFDLNNHKYTEPILSYLQEAFPSTPITIVYGNSVETIPHYIQTHPSEWNQYDLCHIDGGHSYDVFSSDYEQVKSLLKPDGYVIFDDYDYPSIYHFLQTKLKDGDIQICPDKKWIPTHLHFIYSYPNNPKIVSKETYVNIPHAYPQENYSPPITVSLPEWSHYVSTGENTLYGDSLILGGTEEDGAVYSGHVRQNPFTANE